MDASPAQAVARDGAWRLAGMLFIGGSLSAIAPAMLLTDAGEPWKQALITAGLIFGVVCLLLAESHISDRFLVLVPLVSIGMIATATVKVDFFFSYLYLFTAIYVAVVLSSTRALIPYALLMGAVPFLSLLGGEGADRTELRWALSISPALLFLTLVMGRLTSRLEESRQSFEQLSGMDGLTGVGNYRSLQNRLAQEVFRHRRRGREFALLTLDLDRFKQVNETQGHLVGDLVLTIVGSLLNLEVRGEDMVFRQGGDEFAVIAPETSRTEADELGQRLEAALADLTAGDVEISATVSYAIFPYEGREPAELIDAADANLYAKRRSRRSRGSLR